MIWLALSSALWALLSWDVARRILARPTDNQRRLDELEKRVGDMPLDRLKVLETEMERIKFKIGWEI